MVNLSLVNAMWDFKYFLTSDKKTSIAEKMSLLTNKLCVTRFNQYVYNRKDNIDDVFWKYLLTFLLKKKLKKVQKLWCFLMIDFVSCARILYQFVVTKAYSKSKLFFQNPFALDQPLLFISYCLHNKKSKWWRKARNLLLQSDFENHS